MPPPKKTPVTPETSPAGAPEDAAPEVVTSAPVVAITTPEAVPDLPAATAPVVASPPPAVDVAEVAASAAEMVTSKLAPTFVRFERMLNDLGATRAAQDHMRAPAPVTALPVDDDVPTGEVSDSDIPYLAKNITPRQLDMMLALRRGAGDVQRLAELGLIPGRHLVAADSIKITVAGKPREVRAGDKLEIETLDPVEVDGKDGKSGFRAAGLLVSPADAVARGLI